MTMQIKPCELATQMRMVNSQFNLHLKWMELRSLITLILKINCYNIVTISLSEARFCDIFLMRQNVASDTKHMLSLNLLTQR